MATKTAAQQKAEADKAIGEKIEADVNNDLSGLDAQSRQGAKESDGTLVSTDGEDVKVVSSAGQKWNEADAPEPNRRFSVEEDPTGERNAALDKKKK